VATTLSISDLDGSVTLKAKGKRWQADVSVSVADDLGDAVANATVSGVWSGDASGTGSCVTDGSGRCVVSQGGLANRSGAASFTVTGITGSLVYDPAGNADPDGDSDGTSITVSVN
jgi:hypothetical protein